MTMLREFIGSSSGLAPARQGLGLGWVISALTGVAVLLGAKEAEASDCDRSWTECNYSSDCSRATKGREPYRYCPKRLDSGCNLFEGDCWCSSTPCP